MFENTLWLGDCFDVMAMLPDQSVDMILADLPYGTTKCKWDTVLPFDLLWQQYLRITKPNAAIVLTASQPFTSALVMSNPQDFKYSWVYQKSKASNFLNARKNPMKYHEDVLVFGKGAVNYYPVMAEGNSYKRVHRGDNRDDCVYGKSTRGDGFTVENEGTRFPSSVIPKINNKGGRGSLHPTQKPVELFNYLIKTYTQENDVVLDNVAGVFTTAISAIETGRQYICIEKEEKYYNLGYQRVQEYQQSLVG